MLLGNRSVTHLQLGMRTAATHWTQRFLLTNTPPPLHNLSSVSVALLTAVLIRFDHQVAAFNTLTQNHCAVIQMMRDYARCTTVQFYDC